MFEFNTGASDIGSIGDKNIIAVKNKLKSLGIAIMAEDVGLNYGRTIVFNPETCELTITNVGRNNTKII